MKSILTRLSIIVIAFILVILLYRTSPIRFLSFDFFQRINASLFNTFKRHDPVDERIILLNAGTKQIEEIRTYIDLLIKMQAKKIGVNLCHLDASVSKNIMHEYRNSTVVVISDCSKTNHGLSRINNEDNSVTHFRNDDLESFERNIVGNISIPLTKKGRINYSPGIRFYETELDSTKLDHSLIPNSIILIGYLGDYLETDFDSDRELRYFTNARITPVNKYYAYEDIYPDMYDIEISAHIIVSLIDQNLIYDVPKSISVAILFLFMALQSIVMNIVQNKGISISIAITLLSYFLIKMAGSYLIVYLFTKNYYLELDELMMLLVIVIVFNLGLNIFRKSKVRSTVS